MKKLLVIFFSLISFITYSQTGVGYVNYTSYKLFNGTGSQTQYAAFPYSKAEFDNMLNTANSNTTITATGEVPFSYVYNGSTQTPHWGGDFYAIVFDYWFIPQETGTYTFAITSDDASDFSVDGNVIVSYYGGHGTGAWQYGQKQMVAGQRYKIVARYQEYGGGDALYVRWARPSSNGVYSYWNAEITNKAVVPTKQAKMNFDFGSTLDKTKFKIGSALSSTGWVDVTNSVDSVKIGNGYKGTFTGGQVEWSYVTNWDATRMLLNVDLRTFGAFQPSTISAIKIFDVYDGPVTYINSNAYWAVYSIPITTFTPGTYIRDMGAGSYAFKCDVAYSNLEVYKPQSVTMTTTNTLATLYNSIITVSDVWLAFKEVANVGIFGNQSGNEFTYGIQYKNADVNDDGQFNEADAFALLQHLTGKKNIVDTFTLQNTLKLIPTTAYNNIGKSNWNTSPSYLGDTILFDINTGKAIDTFNYAGTWKGDVNLSHSATPASNGITTMAVRTMSVAISTDVNASILTELKDGKFYAYITFDPLQQQVVGTQFQLNYDNSVLKFEDVEFKTKGSPMNYGTDRGTYINLGSLITDGSTLLDNTTEYKITFTPNKPITNGLGLIGMGVTDAVNKAGGQLKVKIN